MHFLEENGFLTPWLAPASKVVLELFVWGLISYLSMKKKFRHFPAKYFRPIFPFLPTHFWPYFMNFSKQIGFRHYILFFDLLIVDT